MSGKVYADGQPAGDKQTAKATRNPFTACFTNASYRELAHKLLNSALFSFVVLGLVLLGVFHPSLPVEAVVLCFFVFECAARMWAMGAAQYMTNPLCYLDLFVTCIDMFSFVMRSDAIGLAMLGRLVRVLKLLRFVRLLKGLRLVKMFRRQFVTVSPGKFACKSPSGTFFSLFADTAFDMSGDGLLSFAELKTAMRINQLMVSNHLLASIFQEIYKVQTQRELLFDNTFHTAYTEPEDRTIQLAAVEEYVRQIRPSTKQERRWRIFTRVLTSVKSWFIFGYFVASAIDITGKPLIGLYDPVKHWYMHVVSCVLWCISGVGYIRIHWANLAQEFDQFEMVEITLAHHFKKVLNGQHNGQQPADSPSKPPPASALLSPTALVVSKATGEATTAVISHLKRRLSQRSLSSSSVFFERADESLSIDDVRTLLSDKNVHISDAALLHWFTKVDTSGDRLISRREILQYLATWKPTTKNGKIVAVFGKFLDFTGMCLVLFLFAALLFLGNALLWKDSVDADTKFTIMIVAVYFWFFGILGFIQIGTQSVSNDFETLESARRSLAVALTDTCASSQLFKAEDYNSTSAWLERLLGVECDPDELHGWIESLKENPYLDTLTYFIAILKHDQPMLSQMTGMPTVVLYRLLEALNWESEKPWVMKEASVHDLKNMLGNYHVLISDHNVERIYREIDTDHSNSVSMAEFESFRSAKQKSATQKRWHIITTRLGDVGFYLQLASLLGCVFSLGPGHLWSAAGASTLSTAGSYEISAFLFWVGTFESVRQAVRTVIAGIDMQEQAKLDFRRSVESVSDAQERQAAARLAALQTKTKALTAFMGSSRSGSCPPPGGRASPTTPFPAPGSNSRAKSSFTFKGNSGSVPVASAASAASAVASAVVFASAADAPASTENPTRQ
jgi:Ca2+-binding EF-hand superfamily protein